MNKTPKYFRKSKNQTGEAITSPTKYIFTPAELEKRENKVKVELASTELRIACIAGRRHRPKERDSKEIQQLEAEISNLETNIIQIHYESVINSSLPCQASCNKLKLASPSFT